jgi:hypothetical protein
MYTGIAECLLTLNKVYFSSYQTAGGRRLEAGDGERETSKDSSIVEREESSSTTFRVRGWKARKVRESSN